MHLSTRNLVETVHFDAEVKQPIWLTVYTNRKDQLLLTEYCTTQQDPQASESTSAKINTIHLRDVLGMPFLQCPKNRAHLSKQSSFSSSPEQKPGPGKEGVGVTDIESRKRVRNSCADTKERKHLLTEIQQKQQQLSSQRQVIEQQLRRSMRLSKAKSTEKVTSEDWHTQ